MGPRLLLALPRGQSKDPPLNLRMIGEEEALTLPTTMGKPGAMLDSSPQASLTLKKTMASLALYLRITILYLLPGGLQAPQKPQGPKAPLSYLGREEPSARGGLRKPCPEVLEGLEDPPELLGGSLNGPH